jgi:hypothetical protein
MSEHFRTPEERGIVIGIAVTFVSSMSAWMSSMSPCPPAEAATDPPGRTVVFYPAKHAPVYPIGYKAPIGFSLACIALTLVFRWLSVREYRSKVVQAEDESISGEEYAVEQEKAIDVDSKSESVPTLDNVGSKRSQSDVTG